MGRALEAFSTLCNGDEFAYLALTSKPEFVVRDQVAAYLHRHLPASYGVAREWRPPGKSKKGDPSWRSDLAILNVSPDPATPAVLLEVKSCYSFDAVKGEAARERFPAAAVTNDVLKSYEYADPETIVMALLIVVHPRAPVPESHFQVVKFATTINSKLAKHGEQPLAAAAHEFLDARLSKIAPVFSSGLLSSGRTFGIPTDTHYWLLGPAKQWN